MKSLINGVKQFSTPMFVVFVVSKLFVGIGIGVLLAQYLLPYGWGFLVVGVVVSLICIIIAAKNI